MKIAICISGQPRFSNFGTYFQKQFADQLPYDVDFYVQTWHEKDVVENQEMLFGRCMPKAIRFDPQYVPINHSDHFHKIRGLSQHYAHYLCMSQIRDLDTYDIIIRTRHDIMFNTDIMDQQIELLNWVNDTKGVAGAGYYPDYNDAPYVDSYLNTPSHRGFSRGPSFDDWTIIAHRDQWSKFRTDDYNFKELLEDMFMDPRNEHINARYDLYGYPKLVCIPELVWYSLTNLNMEQEFKVGKGFVYAARPSLRYFYNHSDIRNYTPAELRDALNRGWQQADAVLQYNTAL